MPESTPLAELVNCTTILQDDSFPFGPVVGGSLTLRARLFACKVSDGARYRGGGTRLTLVQESPPGSDPPLVDLDAQIDCQDDLSVPELWAAPIR
ncbi:hypothetical protein C8Q73DRAFT_712900 [Cubamyces lactineus]|nr:hypothetical protein C8Q73DRAFT_712900 [Cubamyces lactineus]